MKYYRKVFKNGLRIFTIPTKSPTVTVLIIAEVGSNYESEEQNGISHFLEHMCFKGTKKRPTAQDIAMELDGLGAESNAFTYFEYTGYYAKAETKHFKKILDVVSDIYLNPTLPTEELEKERGVILQEINMYEDLPKHKAQDIFAKLLYAGTPAGRTILGRSENIKKLSRDDLENYWKRHYITEKTIVVVAGDIKSETAEKEVGAVFEGLSTAKRPIKKIIKYRQKKPGLLIFRKKTDQTHMVFGFRGYPAIDKRSAALSVLSNILGGGMSSRLFQKLREEMGACYYVRVHNSQHTDYGDFTISTGIDKSRLIEVVGILKQECKKLTRDLVGKKELQKTKDYMVGSLYMGLETSDDLANFYAAEEVTLSKAKQVEKIMEEIRRVSSHDVQRVAKEIFRNEKLNLAVVGDVKNEKEIKKALKL